MNVSDYNDNQIVFVSHNSFTLGPILIDEILSNAFANITVSDTVCLN